MYRLITLSVESRSQSAVVARYVSVYSNHVRAMFTWGVAECKHRIAKLNTYTVENADNGELK
jgi:hypothetical protein